MKEKWKSLVEAMSVAAMYAKTHSEFEGNSKLASALELMSKGIGSFVEWKTYHDREKRIGKQPRVMRMVRAGVQSNNFVEIVQEYNREKDKLSGRSADDVIDHLIGYAMIDPDAQTFFSYDLHLQGAGDIEVGALFLRRLHNYLYCDLAGHLESASGLDPHTTTPDIDGYNVRFFSSRDGLWFATVDVDMRVLLRLSRVLEVLVGHHPKALAKAPRITFAGLRLPQGMSQLAWDMRKGDKKETKGAWRDFFGGQGKKEGCGCGPCDQEGCGFGAKNSAPDNTGSSVPKYAADPSFHGEESATPANPYDTEAPPAGSSFDPFNPSQG